MSKIFDLEATPIEDGVTVIEASAGTGKTYCLTGLVLRLLLERRVSDVSQLLVVTFTRAATQELVERIRSALRDLSLLLAGEGGSDDAFLLRLAATYRDDEEAPGRLREALVRFDDSTVSTIHGFCQRVLSDAAFESGAPFSAELAEDDTPLLTEAARDAWRSLLYPAPAIVAAVAAEDGWDPTTFLDDYRLWRSHPRTEILPEPPDWSAAVACLEAAHEALAGAFDRGGVRAHLERRRFRAGAYLGGGALDERLREAEAFCLAGGPGRLSAGLRAVHELSVERLERSIFKRDQKGVGRHPAIRAATAFAAATDGLRHALRCRFLAEVDARFEAAKRAELTWTYDDLLRRVRDALRDPGRGPALVRDLRRRYRAALVDEFQDTDLVQYDIFRRLFRSGPLFLIGDPKQAIYRFRGADVFAYLSARGEADRTYTLARNWRAEKPLVEAVSAVFGRARPFVFDEIAFERVEAVRVGDVAGSRRPPLEWLWIPRQATRDETRAALERAVASEAAGMLAGGGLDPGDVAVLVRTNDEATAMQAALTAAGVPAVVGRAGDVFETEEMVEVFRLLAAVADPTHGPRLRAAWATRLWGDDARAIFELDRDDEAFASRLERFAEARDDWRRRGFMPMVQRLLAERRVRARLLAAPGGERRLTNLDHAVELLHAAGRRRSLSPAAILDWLAVELAGQRPASEETELRLASDAAAVQVVTVHRSKGLEYEVVFCPYLWEARPVEEPPVPVHLEPERLALDCGSDRLAEHLALAEAERLSEDARLVYVALTRARRRCVVAWGDVPGGDGPEASALGYLLSPAPRREGPEAPPGEWALSALRAVSAGRERWRADLEDLVARHAAVMELRDLDAVADVVAGAVADTPARLDPSPATAAPAGTFPALRPRALRRPVPSPWSLESFSSLSRGGEAEAPDHSDPATLEALRPAGPEDDRRTTGLRAFARGRRAGTCLHQVLERCDLARLADPETDRRIAEALARHGLAEASSHRSPPWESDFDPAAAVRDLLLRLAGATLPGEGFSLGEIDRERSLVEWKFTTPLAPVAAGRLAAVFRRHASGAVRDDYAARLEGLSAGVVRGFLTGFVDLLFTHEDRWFLVDWKSNDLGDREEAYGPESLWRAMCHHHYVLQYHLYLFALHRFLRQRLPDYDYERHVAGAFYVFLRGLGSAGSGRGGWYVDRPPPKLIAALDELVDGGRPR